MEREVTQWSVVKTKCKSIEAHYTRPQSPQTFYPCQCRTMAAMAFAVAFAGFFFATA